MKGFFFKEKYIAGTKGPVLTIGNKRWPECPYHAAYLSALCARAKHIFLGFAFVDMLLRTLQFSLTVLRNSESR